MFLNKPKRESIVWLCLGMPILVVLVVLLPYAGKVGIDAVNQQVFTASKSFGFKLADTPEQDTLAPAFDAKHSFGNIPEADEIDNLDNKQSLSEAGELA
ncbi:MAG: hypothetical protein SGCHY_005319, partial [Lobulomycetales sp.]